MKKASYKTMYRIPFFKAKCYVILNEKNMEEKASES